jgi:hypothetical protein
MAIATDFPRYGAGTKKHSHYCVEVEWADAEKIIERFCEAGLPEAISLQESRKLGAAISELEWRAPVAEK